MNTIQNVMDGFVQKSLRKEKIYSDLGVVSDVDLATNTCTVTPESGDAPRFLVKFYPVASSTGGLLLTPSDGSTVAYMYTSPTDAVITLFSDVDDVIFQGGANDGLVKVNELVSNIQTRETRINNIVLALQAISAAAAATGTTPVTGASLAGFINGAISAILTPIPTTSASTLKNDKFKH